MAVGNKVRTAEYVNIRSVIYQNATPPPKYVIVESKYGSSTLNPKTKDGPQMSDDWIKGSDRLEKAIEDIDIVDDIRFNLDNNPENVQKVLSEIDKSGNVTMYKINPDGSKGDLWL
ncbi:cytosolic protein [Capnocytophaga canimorsus]|uniref:Cytosolic protein n=1 Tax=Capnocytophaga canimorsus TaxID=28188 RepID=A0A250G5D4_9FLAO|nr:cytosolic protein [Capnocytophaga canimorsus]ATA92411.1 cytosolic protein [Capnocytophaga canimorsus]